MKLISILSLVISTLTFGAVHSVILDQESETLAESINTLEKTCNREIIAMAKEVNESFASSKLDILSVEGNKAIAVCFGKSY